MRLSEVEKGDGFTFRLLIKFISIVSGMRLPDAARIVMYHRDFYSKPMTAWTQAAMRGESNWSVGEREFFVSMIAKWNACAFCIDAHSSIASLVLDQSMVNAAIGDFREAQLPSKLYNVLIFLEILTKTPDNLTSQNVLEALKNGITAGELEDAIAICTLFSITVRCADTFNFQLLDNKDSIRGAKRMLKQGYTFGKSKTTGPPDHKAFAEMLRKRILEEPGKTDVKLRQAMANRASGGVSIEKPYDELALCIGKAAYNCTDEQIKNVIKKAGSQKAAFELITAAAVGAGLYRWNKGLSVMNATS
jgi:alkylhydroperoxidase family enzyme